MPFPFQVLILGSGSAIPGKGKNHTSQLVIYNSKHYLLDCGEGCQIQLRKFNISIQKIDHIFISHLHGDHYLGLPGLISSMNLLGREKGLNIYGPKGLKDLVDLHFSLANSKCSFPLNFIETNNKEVNDLVIDGEVIITSFPMKHKIPTTGFLVKGGSEKRKLKKDLIEEHQVPKHLRAGIAAGKDYKNPMGEIIPNKQLTDDPLPIRSYAFCADTVFKPELSETLKEVNMMYHEASFLKHDEKKAKEVLHSTAEQAAILAERSEAGKLLIGHFSNKYNNDQAFLDEARSIFKNTDIAIEGQYYEIN